MKKVLGASLMVVALAITSWASQVTIQRDLEFGRFTDTGSIVKTPSGYLFTFNGQAITAPGDFTVSGDALVSGSLTVDADLDIAGDVTITGEVNGALPDKWIVSWTAGAQGYTMVKVNGVIPAPSLATTGVAAVLAAIASSNVIMAQLDPVMSYSGDAAYITPHVGGGITLNTLATSGRSAWVLPQTVAGLLEASPMASTTWSSDKDLKFEAYIQTEGIWTATVVVGLKLTTTETPATDAEQIIVRGGPSVNSGKWSIVSSKSNVDTYTDSGVTCSSSTLYHISIVVAASGVPTVTINGTSVAGAALKTTGHTLLPMVGIHNNNTVAKSLTVLGIRMSRTIQ